MKRDSGNNRDMRLFYFLMGGFTIKYGLALMELLVSTISNMQALHASKVQLEMSKIAVEIEALGLEQESQMGQIGFLQDNEVEEDYYDEEDYDE